MRRNNRISIASDVLHLGGALSVSFMRTLRIPDDGKTYPLPPGLGRFPLRRVDDYSSRVPRDWRKHGGVFLPMYQREAMWIHFASPGGAYAVKVGIGKICAITGKRWSERLHRKPQDYLVAPDQPWLDGIVVRKGIIRQFVAMPLGLGYTIEGQVTGDERFGGIQIKAFPAKPGRIAPPRGRYRALCVPASAMAAAKSKRSSGDMGLGAGGRMKQKVYTDPHGVDVWDQHGASRVFVHIVNSELWEEVTGEPPPRTPVTARSYADAGLPWFDLYDEGEPTVKPRRPLKKIKSIKHIDKTKSKRPLQDDDPVHTGPVSTIWHHISGCVRDGDW